MNHATDAEQAALCRRFGAEFCAASDDSKLGVASNVRTGLQPINGLRHPPQGDTNGWYIWAGEHLSQDPDFFKPLHVSHLEQWCPQVIKYLGLAPGRRFLIADGYEDVWFDEELLTIRGNG